MLVLIEAWIRLAHVTGIRAREPIKISDTQRTAQGSLFSIEYSFILMSFIHRLAITVFCLGRT